ncbi:glycosyltransferase family 2 protein [Niveispirillum sp. KHB5.9]|uniref:glycosyltransferase family 2 protein n=1 Tax=Niveispirillum sp. KHB5.9 TaxID=3400269 RepID=UPI003A872EDD
MPDKLPLSVFIIALNEADRIGPVIQAVSGWADEVLVVDSGSTDGTQDLAPSLGATVIHNDWPGYGPQKRFAEERCRHDWLLNLDADEVPVPELEGAIRALFAGGAPPLQGYRIQTVMTLPHQQRPHRFAPRHNYIRLYDRRHGRFADSVTHDAVEMQSGTVGSLAPIIVHYSIRSHGDLITKLNRYSTAQAEEIVARGKGRRYGTFRAMTEFPVNLFRYFFLKGYWVFGLYGLELAAIIAFFRFARIAKVREILRTPP